MTDKAHFFKETKHEYLEFSQHRSKNSLKVACNNCSNSFGYLHVTPGQPEHNKYSIYLNKIRYSTKPYEIPQIDDATFRAYKKLSKKKHDEDEENWDVNEILSSK
jgi:hypothetical protein